MPARKHGVLTSGLLSLCLMSLAVGCAYRKPVATGFLERYDELQRQSSPYAGVYAHRARPARRAPQRVDHVVQLLPSVWEGPKVDPELESELRVNLDARMSIHLKKTLPRTILLTRSRDVEPFLAAGANVTQVRVAITDLDNGFGLFRMLLGFYLGAVTVQIEGRLIDARTGQPIATFARRTLDDGKAFGFPTPQALSARFSWRFAIDRTAKILVSYIAAQTLAPPQRWWVRMKLTQKVNPPENEKSRPTERYAPVKR